MLEFPPNGRSGRAVRLAVQSSLPRGRRGGVHFIPHRLFRRLPRPGAGRTGNGEKGVRQETRDMTIFPRVSRPTSRAQPTQTPKHPTTQTPPPLPASFSPSPPGYPTPTASPTTCASWRGTGNGEAGVRQETGDEMIFPRVSRLTSRAQPTQTPKHPPTHKFESSSSRPPLTATEARLARG